jgi:FAD/FMN-containing dehydrogenase
LSETLEKALADALGPRAVTTEREAFAVNTRDWRGRYKGEARCMVQPTDTTSVSKAIRICAAHSAQVVPQGGNTGVCGGAIPDRTGKQVILNLARLNKVRSFDPIGNIATVEAGCILAEVRRRADEIDRIFPLDLGSEGSCQIGGNVASNAGGTGVLRYGNMRDLVLGLEVVLPDGRIWNGLRGLRKDNAGYDLKQLFIGSEGTLGVITAAAIKLFPKPRASATGFVALPSNQAALELFLRLRSVCGARLTAAELMSKRQLAAVCQHIDRAKSPIRTAAPWYLLAELNDTDPSADLRRMLESVLGKALEDGLVADGAVAASSREADAFWHLRHSVSEANVRSGRVVSHDTSVPIASVPQFIERAQSELSAAFRDDYALHFVGHMGDGNVHVVAIFPSTHNDSDLACAAATANTVVHDIAVSLGGSIAAEHGIGQSLRDQLLRYKDTVELDLMRGLKTWLDPAGMMNPGKVVLPNGGPRLT